MIAIKQLQIGEKVAVLCRGRNYSSIVEDMPASGTLVIAQPSNQSVYLDLDGDEAEVLFHKEDGIYTFRVRQEEKFTAGGIPMLRLKAVTAVKRSQRRSWYRLEKNLPVKLSVKEEIERGPGSLTIKARTINISGGGCRIAIRQPLVNDARLECRITLSPDMELMMDGQVVWMEKRTGEDRTSVIGVQFVDEDPAVQKKLLRYVTSEQRKQLKDK